MCSWQHFGGNWKTTRLQKLLENEVGFPERPRRVIGRPSEICVSMNCSQIKYHLFCVRALNNVRHKTWFASEEGMITYYNFIFRSTRRLTNWLGFKGQLRFVVCEKKAKGMHINSAADVFYTFILYLYTLNIPRFQDTQKMLYSLNAKLTSSTLYDKIPVQWCT